MLNLSTYRFGEFFRGVSLGQHLDWPRYRMSTEELRYPLKREGHTYEVVEDRGQVICTGLAAAPPSAY